MKTALIHYWLVTMRGGERVLEALCRMYPQADIFTHVVDRSKLSPLLQERNIYTTFVQHLPFSKRLYRQYLPLMPLALEQLDLTDYDLVISCESGPAKGIITRADTPHVCYCHSPMRYLWDFHPLYLAAASPLLRFCMRPLFSHMRQWDVLSAQRVDHFVANSRTSARRIRKHWGRDAAVVYPPVDVHATMPTMARGAHYLCLGQLVDYKRVDLAVQACTRLGRSLIVAGDGPCLKALKAMAGPTIRFIGSPAQTDIPALYAQCRALLFPGEEDFGMVPVEAMAAGAPVLAYGRGGVTETVLDGITGSYFAQQSVDALCDAIRDFENKGDCFDPQRIREHALYFDEARFIKGIQEEVQKTCALVKGYGGSF